MAYKAIGIHIDNLVLPLQRITVTQAGMALLGTSTSTQNLVAFRNFGAS
jgi:hypothetical protein